MVDETTKGKQDSSSGKSGQASGGKSGSTSKGKLYTDEQIAKIKSDAAAEAGRQRKQAEQERDSLKKQLQNVTDRLDGLERERDEARLAEIRNDPDKLRAYQAEKTASREKQELEDIRRDIEREREQLKVDREADAESRKQFIIGYVSAKYGVEEEKIEKYAHHDLETVEAIAKGIATDSKTEKPSGKGEGEEESEEEWTPDTGEPKAGEGQLTTEQVDGMSMSELEKTLKKASE